MNKDFEKTMECQLKKKYKTKKICRNTWLRSEVNLWLQFNVSTHGKRPRPAITQTAKQTDIELK